MVDRYAGSTIMQIAFNKRAVSITDPAIVDMRRINEQMTKTAVPGRYMGTFVSRFCFNGVPLEAEEGD
jgi:hypothetical protein